jgi:hypothetical protein
VVVRTSPEEAVLAACKHQGDEAGPGYSKKCIESWVECSALGNS